MDPNIPIQRGEMLAQRGFSLERVYMHSLVGKDHKFEREVNLAFLQDPNIPLERLLEFRQQNNLFGNRQDFSSIYGKFDQDGRVIDMVMVLYLNSDPGKPVKKEQYSIVNLYIQTRVYNHFILITEYGLGPDSAKSVKESSLTRFIEVFKDNELAFNRTKHALAPIKVRHVPAVEVKSVAAEEGIQQEKLPLILNVDALSKWYGARPLDIFMTEIVGTTTDTAGYYRLVRTFNEKKPAKKSAVKK